MIIFLYGPDSYRRFQKQSSIEKAYRDKRGNISDGRFDLDKAGELDRFNNFVINVSMFEDMKLAILDNAYEAIDDKRFRAILKNELESKNVVLLISEDKKPLVKVKFLLDKPVQSQEFEELTGAKLKTFIKKEAEERSLKLPEKTIEAIQDSFGSDTWTIVTELDKMALNGSPTLRKPKADFFMLTNTLKGSRDIRQKLVALEFILSDRKDDAARVFNSLSYRLNSKQEAATLAAYDVAVKSGKLDYEEVLVDLALS